MNGLMIGRQLTAEQRIQSAVIKIMGHERYLPLSGILMVGNRAVVDDGSVKTAQTDGRDELYNRAFVDGLTDPQLRYLILHESWHKMYRHLITWQWMYEEDAETANQACDYAINIRLDDDNRDGFAQMPPSGLVDARFRGMDSAQIYAILRQEKQGQGQGQGQGQQGQGQGQGQGQQGGGFDEHDWAGAKDIGDDKQASDALAREIDEAIRQGALSAGKTGTGKGLDLGAFLQPKVDWREVLREFVSTTMAGNDFSTWARPNRRYIGMGIYMPSGITQRVGELVVAVDMSGSTSGIRERFMGEVAAVCTTCKPDAVHVMYWDTKVAGYEKYIGDEVNNLARVTKPAGGGGTLIDCVPQYMREHGIRPKAVVVLTDGELGGQWGQWDVPVLWCIVGRGDSTPPVGKVVLVDN